MLSQGHGAIVNVASTAALEHGAGNAAYAASKAAAVALVDSLAEDLFLVGDDSKLIRGAAIRV